MHDTFQPLPGLVAFLFPGAGHWLLGEARRALLVALGILGLFVSGLLIGGIDVVDRQENPIWFVGQALIGPLTFGVDYLHQNQFKVIDPATGQRRTPRPEIRDESGRVVTPAEVRGPGGIAQFGAPGQRPPKSRALGRMNELGTLFITIAGMLNLIAILDAAFHPLRQGRDQGERARRLMGARRAGGPGEDLP
jgi:hypothetical protein